MNTKTITDQELAVAAVKLRENTRRAAELRNELDRIFRENRELRDVLRNELNHGQA